MLELHITPRQKKHMRNFKTRALSVAVSLTLALSLFGAAGLPALAEPGTEGFEAPPSDILLDDSNAGTGSEFVQTPPPVIKFDVVADGRC